MVFSKYFTPLEAKKRLPLVKKIVEDILAKGHTLRLLSEAAETQDQLLTCYQIKEEVEDLMRELENLGCYYKDWNFQIGIVDFPAKINGEDVFLCWKSDEEDLTWYHRIEDGFRGRKKIPESYLSIKKPQGEVSCT